MFVGETASQDAQPNDPDFGEFDLLPDCEAPKSGHGGHRLNERQREFARQYVLTGGNATKAAALSGYSSPASMGNKCITHGSILAEIKRLSIINTSALLPVAIRQLLLIGCDPEADTRARVQALTALLDRGGMKPKSDGPAVQVNVQINGQQAQAAIAEVWEARERRLTTSERLSRMGSAYQQRQMSDIAGGMSDIVEGDDDSAAPSLPAPAATWPTAGVGGVKIQGPSPAVHLIPTPPTEHAPSSPESLFDD